MNERVCVSLLSKLVFFIPARYARPLFSAILAGFLVVSTSASTLAQNARDTDQTLCVLVPHFKDDYWLSVAFGLEQEAERQSVDLELFEAGGYQALKTQIAQIEECAERRMSGILLGAVSSDHPDLLAALSDATRSTLLFGLVNELHSDVLSGRVGVDWRDMGHILGLHLAARFPKGSAPMKAALVSGPVESGWAAPLEAGLRKGLSDSAVEIVQVYGADTGLRQQLDLVQEALLDYPEIDILIGSAPAVEAAMGVFRTRAPGANQPLLFSTYVNHSTKRGLLNGNIQAAPFDDPTLQGILAVRLAVAVLDRSHTENHTGPPITLLAQGEDDVKNVMLSPPGYFPELD